jgi:hypothetical protein
MSKFKGPAPCCTHGTGPFSGNCDCACHDHDECRAALESERKARAEAEEQVQELKAALEAALPSIEECNDMCWGEACSHHELAAQMKAALERKHGNH